MILAMNITACAATNCVEDPVPLGGAEMMPTNGEVVDVIIGRLVWRVLEQVTDSTERLGAGRCYHSEQPVCLIGSCKFRIFGLP
ncbi:uncharacterized protein OCT59_021654 [Rhizophagus irregularis]|uniref:uncharacterized protein n=1 Tax=Rhizophagus irregularis TaxID=588596 RepID=UPI0033336C66|nr:hypothetical protein OCT59_021654 [Rhizophagus irregularis]